jgi:hypothetical protein
MPSHRDPSVSRRRFIQFVAGSPALVGVSGTALAQMLLPKGIECVLVIKGV